MCMCGAQVGCVQAQKKGITEQQPADVIISDWKPPVCGQTHVWYFYPHCVKAAWACPLISCRGLG